MESNRNHARSMMMKSALYLITLAITVYLLVFMPTPYMINKPGTAEEIGPMVTVTDGDPEEEGAFMLTTVSVSYANIASLISSQFDRHSDVVRKEPDRNEEEYETQQRYYMNHSQSSAVIAAYRKADISFSIVPEYVFVIGLSKSFKTKGDFLSGDVIQQVDGRDIVRFEDLSAVTEQKSPGEIVQVQLRRDGQIIHQDVELISISNPDASVKSGLGVSVGEVRKIVPKSAGDEVKFTETSIGGPSAGLMFAMEIYNQLTPGDLSKGLRIAGTGTMDEDGNVGAIGGVQYKIVASNREKADVFFVPEDNYKVARAKAEEIGSAMKLVPVKTIDDALKYIDTLN